MLDQVWKEHLLALDHLRQGIGLRAYGQRDPLNEYKTEAFALFNAMLDELKERVTMMLARVEIGAEPPQATLAPAPVPTVEQHPEPAFAGGMAVDGDVMAGTQATAMATSVASAAIGAARGAVDPTDPSTWNRSPRNAPCPCGSGKKYKHCHGKSA